MKRPVSIEDFIDSKLFANMQNMTMRQLEYRISLRQVVPMPARFNGAYIFDELAEVIIPEPKRLGGRPKGSTLANGARSPGAWDKQKGRKLSKKRGKSRGKK